MSKSLRRLLVTTEPKDFPLKRAWPLLIQALRAHKRASGEVRLLSSRKGVEQVLSMVPLDEELAARVKPLLRELVRSNESADVCRVLALQVDDLLVQAMPSVVVGEVLVEVTGWPAGFESELQARMLRRPGPPPYRLPAVEAAALHHEFDGMRVAGARLKVSAVLAEGQYLPAVPRGLRARPPRRGRRGPWLPHWDPDGRRYLTPRRLAERLALQLVNLGVRQVVDACAGLGGNSIAFAEAGLSVLAVESDPARLRLAQRNAEELGVAGRIEWCCGRIEVHLPSLPEGLLFLDPPWVREHSSLPDWVPFPEDRPVVLKAPAAFDPSVLPARPWRVQFEFGEGEDDASILKMLTLWSV